MGTHEAAQVLALSVLDSTELQRADSRDGPRPGRPYELAKPSFKKAVTLRSSPGRPVERSVLFTNCRVVDVESGTYLQGGQLQQVLVRAGRIAAVLPADAVLPAASSGQLSVVVDCNGRVVMPGLQDAHVHVTAVTADLAALQSLPESYVASRAAGVLAGMLIRGFTTVRDAGGADFGLAQAVDEGVVLGPKLLFTGHALSQTGGHGDFRGRGEDVCACGAALRGIGRVCDGDAEVRKAARDELRRGAHCIKVMASGGVASPTDKLTSTQFSVAELTAIVEEAEATGTYVCAHAYKPNAIRRAVECGVRSIEHGNWLDPETAALMASKGCFLVPTLVTYWALATNGEAAGMPKELVAKVGDCVSAGLTSLSVAQAAGVTMCFGSDLLGDLHRHQGEEFVLRSEVLPPAEILRAATHNCARLFGTMSGQVRQGWAADLLLVDGDPLGDVSCLAEAENTVLIVMREGLFAKVPRHGAWWGANEAIVTPA